MKLTRQQRLGLLLTGILMALVAMLCAVLKPQPAVDAQAVAGPTVEKPTKVNKQKKKKPKSQPVQAPTPRKHLDEDF